MKKAGEKIALILFDPLDEVLYSPSDTVEEVEVFEGCLSVRYKDGVTALYPWRLVHRVFSGAPKKIDKLVNKVLKAQ